MTRFLNGVLEQGVLNQRLGLFHLNEGIGKDDLYFDLELSQEIPFLCFLTKKKMIRQFTQMDVTSVLRNKILVFFS